MQGPGPGRDLQATLRALTASVGRKDWIAAREWVAEFETGAQRQKAISNKTKWAELLSSTAIALIAIRANDAEGCVEVLSEMSDLLVQAQERGLTDHH